MVDEGQSGLLFSSEERASDALGRISPACVSPASTYSKVKLLFGLPEGFLSRVDIFLHSSELSTYSH